MAVSNLLLFGVLLLTANHAFAQDTIPPQVFNCPMEEVRGPSAATTGGTSPVTWVSVSAFNLGTAGMGTSLPFSERNLYGQVINSPFPYGFTTVGFEYIDNQNPPQNIALCTFFVAVPVIGDTTPPTVTCPVDQTVMVGSLSTQGTASWVEPVPVDNNNIVRRSWRSHAPNSLFPLGLTTVTYRWLDPSNSMPQLECTFTITVSTLGTDNVVPSLTCPNDFMTTSPNPTWTVPTPSDASGVLPIQGSHNPGGAIPIAFTTVTYTVTDNSGNRASCSFLISRSTGNDQNNPVITSCPQNIQQTAVSATSLPTIIWTAPAAYDGAGEVRLVMNTHSSGSTFPIGTTSVEYRFQDTAGLIANCVFNVVVSAPGPCANVQCLNGGFCQVLGTTFTCQCQTGFTGQFCQTSASPCASVQCLNGGFCQVLGTTFTCQCQTGFTGQFCQTSASPCASVQCLNGGFCQVLGTTFTCQCQTGFTGQFCQTSASPCASVQCLNGGFCQVLGTTFTCQCQTGFTGQFCQTSASPCASVQCLNGGFCQVLGTTFTCQCQTGFTGQFCQTSAMAPLVVTCPANRILAATDSQNIVLAQPTVTGAVGVVTYQYYTLSSTGSLTPLSNAVLSTTSPSVTTIATSAQDQSGRTAQFCTYQISVSAANLCSPNPCLNSGTCSQSSSAFSCACTAQFTGNTCQSPVSQIVLTCPASRTVEAANSQNIVLAQPTVTGAVGVVTYRYFTLSSTGSLTPVSNAVLSRTAPSVTTIATSAQDQSGRAAVFCTYTLTVNAAADLCSPNPCSNGGTCSSSSSAFSCACTAQFTGNTCQSPVAQIVVTCPASRTVEAANSQNIVLAQPTVTGAVGVVTYRYFTLSSTGSLTPVSNAVLSRTAPSVTTIATSAQDQSGRAAVFCTYTLTVNAAADTVIPVFADCPGPVVAQIAVGQVQAFAGWTPPTATDNSNVNPTVISTHQPGFFAAGSFFVTYTATDASGNAGTCSFSVQVLPPADTVIPVFADCPGPVVAQIAAGQVQAFAGWTPPTATDNSNVNPTVISTHQPGFFAAGSFFVTYTATDASGNAGTCSFTVQVLPPADTVIPVFADCPGPVVAQIGVGQVQAFAGWTAPTATDNSNVNPTVISTHQPGFYAAGSFTVIYTATDASGNAATCSFSVQVLPPVDTVIPVFADCPGPVVAQIGVGQVQAFAGWTPPTATDNSNVNPTVISTHQPGFFAAGSFFVTYTATDASGNAGTCSFSVQVLPPVDTVIPVFADCPGPVVAQIAAGQVQAFAGWTPPTATDNSNVNPTVISTHQPGFFAAGSFTVIYTATDASGNAATCSFSVQVLPPVDTVIPVFADCPGPVVAQIAAGQVQAFAGWTPPTATDNSNVNPTVISTHQPGFFAAGSFFVTYTATDASGNAGTCSFSVQVLPPVDTVIPVFADCPGPVVAQIAAGQVQAFAGWTPPTATDNSNVNPTVISTHQPGFFAAGSFTVIYTATDASGNAATCSFSVQVLPPVDTVIPVFADCPGPVVAQIAVGQLQAFAGWTPPTATDNSNVNPTVISTHQPGFFAAGSFFVTYTATDASGNAGTCSFSVQVLPPVDTVIPVFADCPGPVVAQIAAGQVQAFAGWTPPTATDNSNVNPTVISTHQPGFFAAGSFTVIYTATDASGNAATCSFSVQVLPPADTVIPVFADCPGPVVSQIAVGQVQAFAGWTPPTATDNSNVNPTVISTHQPGFYPAGSFTVIYTATDASGNAATCSFTVQVNQEVDSEVPVISDCPQMPVTAEVPLGLSQVFVSWTEPTVTDAIDPVPTLTSTASPGFFPVSTFGVTYTASDAAGNQAFCTFVVIVTPQADTVPPMFVNCQEGTISAAVPFLSSTVDVQWTVPTAVDNSGNMPTITVSPRGPGAFSVGTYEIVYTATDLANNMATCTFNLNVVQIPDTELPVLVDCPADINREIPVGSSAVVVSWVAPTATDNSLVNPVPVVSPRGPGSFNAGTHPITYTATDGAGNVATCSFNIFVTVGVDGTMPVLTSCPTTIIRTIEFNSAETVNVDWALPTATDNSNEQVTVTKVSGPERGAALGAGVHEVVYNLADARNNFVQCRFCIVINTADTIAPMITCPADIVETIEIGSSLGKLISWAAPTVSDASLGPITVTLLTTKPSGSFFAVGTNGVQYSATDLSGGTSMCDFTVTINPVDTTPPVFTRCPSNIVYNVFELPTGGVSVNWAEPLYTDASNSASVTARTPPAGTLFTTTPTQVSYTVTDSAGLTAECSFSVTVVVSNPCTINPCGMGGNCVPTGPNTNDFKCVCAPCFSGLTCQISTNPCINNNCASGSNCVPVIGSCVAYTCQCSPCSYGRFCDQRVNSCDNHKCANGAMCNPQGCLQYTCSCSGCFQGPTCSDVYSACNPSPCMNGGFCNPLTNSCTGYICQCAGCFTGFNCQTAIPNPCDQNPCQNGGACRRTTDLCYAYECDCTGPFSGPRCQGVTVQNNPCNSFPCANGAACLNMDGEMAYTCKCQTGYTGVRCEIEITATGAVAACSASPNPCLAGICKNSYHSTSSSVAYVSQYICVCNNGFTGSNCATQSSTSPGMDVCATLVRPCANGGVCNNVYNSFTQSVEYYCMCNPAFIGQHCETSVVNPCLVNPCMNGGQCTQNQLQFACACSVGFTGPMCENTAGDTVAPIITFCPTNIIRNVGTQQSLVLNWPSPIVIDGVLEYQSHQADQSFNVGTNTPVTYIYADAAGNVAKCQFNVLIYGDFVADTSSPVIGCPSAVSGFIYGNEQSVRVTFPNPTVFDNQGNPLVTSDRESGSLFAEGTVQVTFTVTDISGNTAACTLDVTVTRVPGFTMQCPDPVSLELPPGTDCHTYNLPNPTYTNQAGTPTLGYRVTNGGATGQQFYTNVPFSGTIIYRARDVLGQEAECTFQLTLSSIASPCTGIVCQNGGACIVSGTSFNCQCTGNFGGQFCQTPVQGPCSGIICQNGGNCQVPAGSTLASCMCPATHTGTLCETPVTGFNIACTDTTAMGNPGSTVTVNLPTPTFTGTVPTFFFVNTQGMVITSPDTYQVAVPANLPATETITVIGLQGGVQAMCEIDITISTAGACSNNPCLNNGVCTNTGAGFSCACTPGFTGTNCQLPVGDACTNVNCQNGGVCQVTGSTVNCLCVNGFTGPLCATAPTGGFQLTCSDTTASGPVGSTQLVNLPQPTFSGTTTVPSFFYVIGTGSTIISDRTAYPVVVPATGSAVMMVTVYGISSDNRQTTCIIDITVTAGAVTPCSSNPCMNGGNCNVIGNIYQCACPVGFTGVNCQLGPCNGVFCQNGGACLVNGNTFSCQCINGFTGTFCATAPTGPCTGVFCQNGGACLVNGNTFSCQCINGFTGTFCATAPTALQITCGSASVSASPSAATTVALPQPTFTGSTVTPNFIYTDQNGNTIQNPLQFPVTAPAANSVMVNVGVTGVVGNQQHSCTIVVTVTAINPCLPNPCPLGQECFHAGGDFLCVAMRRKRRRRSVDRLELPGGISVCDSHPCAHNGTCLSVMSAKYGEAMRCQCMPGWTGPTCLNEMFELELPGDHSPEVWDKEEMSVHWMMVAVIGILALIIMTMSVTFMRFVPRRTISRMDDIKLIH